MLAFGWMRSAKGARAALLAGATVAAVVGLGAGSASAAPLCTGGKITGEGSSLQKIAQLNVWAPKFHAEICNKGSEPTVEYKAEGSGAGLKAWGAEGKGFIDRTRQFIGTDDAPTSAQIENIQKSAGGGNLLVIPVAQTAISFIANPPSGCTVEAITNQDLEKVFRGVDTSWSDLATAEGECSSPITRVVRFDGSGTSYQLKNYLFQLNAKGLPCTTGGTEKKSSWKEMEPISNSETGAPNTSWPETCGEATLSSVVRPGAKGGGEEVKKVNATDGSIGYAALPDAEANLNSETTTILAVQNNGQGQALPEVTFGDPATEASTANCTAIGYKVPIPARNQSGSTGENADWSQVFGARPKIGGVNYPLCTLTYDLAFHGYRAAGFPSSKGEVTVSDYLREYVTKPLKGQPALELSGTFYGILPNTGNRETDVQAAAQFAAGKISY